MNKILTVVRKEYLERVRSRSFVIGTVLGPAVMALFILGPALLAGAGGEKERQVGVVDLSGQVYEKLQHDLDARGDSHIKLVPIPCGDQPPEGCAATLKQMILDDSLFAGIVVPADFIDSRKVTYYNTSVSASVVREEALEPALDRVLRETRFDEAGVPSSLHDYVLAGSDWTSISVKAGAETEQNEAVSFAVAFVLIFILYMMMLLYGNQALLAVIEEKGSRMAEILLSSLQPGQLMLGKVLGLGLAGMTQFGVWVLTFIILSVQGVSFGDFQLDVSALTPIILVSFVVFFVLGFFLYAMLFAGVGAMCNSVQDAQQFNSVLMMGNIIPMVMLSFVMRQPDALASVVLSLVPLFAPVLMFMRVAIQTPPMWQIALSWALLLVSIVIASRMAGKLFRVGILLYGASPTWGSLVRALRS